MKPLVYLMLFLLPSICLAQNKYPHVNEIVKEYDANADGFLTKEEVSKSNRYSRQFARWDANKDNKVDAQEIAAMRAKFGIAADGSIKPGGVEKAKPNPPSSTLSIPDISDLMRADRNNRPPREQAMQSAFILKTKPHEVVGNAYFILTDHSDEDYLASLRKLAKHHDGEIHSVKDLGVFYKDKEAFASLRNKMTQSKVKYVAIAPRLESFRENMLLSMWELLTTLDDDPQLDCFPGFLVASNVTSFAKLIDQSINHKPIAPLKLKPVAINQVQSSKETRSLQKSAILRKHFEKANIETPIVAIYGQAAKSAPRLQSEHTWNLTVKGRKQFVKELPSQAEKELAAANLVVMHGHGIPGMSCSLDIDGIPTDFGGKVLLSGSCFSANPIQSDFASMREAPGGYQLEKRDAFIIRAIDNGAIAAFGHQRLSSGFPHLYPVLESWTRGESVGQGYQQLINGLIDLSNKRSGEFVVAEQKKNNKRVPQNSLLYVVIGDPAMSPFESQPKLK